MQLCIFRGNLLKTIGHVTHLCHCSIKYILLPTDKNTTTSRHQQELGECCHFQKRHPSLNLTQSSRGYSCTHQKELGECCHFQRRHPSLNLHNRLEPIGKEKRVYFLETRALITQSTGIGRNQDHRPSMTKWLFCMEIRALKTNNTILWVTNWNMCARARACKLSPLKLVPSVF